MDRDSSRGILSLRLPALVALVQELTMIIMQVPPCLGLIWNAVSNSYQGHTNNIQLSPEGEVNSGGYIPRCKASRYISTALHRPLGGQLLQYLPNQMDKKTLLQFLPLKLSRNDAPFFSQFAKQWISKDIPSYSSQSKRAKIAIH